MTMEIYYDIVKTKKKFIWAINRYGFSPEHNYYNYLYTQNPLKKGVFFDFGKRKGIIAFYNKSNNTWRVINGVFATKAERLSVLLDFIGWAFAEKKSKKIF